MRLSLVDRYSMIDDYLRILSTFIRSHVSNERGASLVEYALLVALIALVCIGAATFLGKTVSKRIGGVGSSLGS